MSYNNHSRFFFRNYQEIQDLINIGEINEWDIVICSDTQEMLLVTKDFELIPIKTRVNRFASIDVAESYLNSVKDTYDGQIVSIFSETGTYKAYVVNQRSNGRFYVTNISSSDSFDINYDQIANRPIINESGNIESPVLLTELKSGTYKVKGAYKIADGLSTIFQSANADLYLINHAADGSTAIKIITAYNITDYTVSEDGEITSQAVVPTTKWLEDRGYTNNDDLDRKLEALHLITKEEAQAYIQNYMDNYIAESVEHRVDISLADKFVKEDNQNIQKLFM